jgi:hypothetical protein
VIGDEPDRSLRAFFHGQPAERLLRAAQRPVLVARLDARAGGYGRILVAVDLMDASRPLVDLACAFDSAAEIELFHAFTAMHEGKLRYADVSAQVIDAYRHACARHARERMLWLSDASSARRNRVVSSGRGRARQTRRARPPCSSSTPTPTCWWSASASAARPWTSCSAAWRCACCGGPREMCLWCRAVRWRHRMNLGSGGQPPGSARPCDLLSPQRAPRRPKRLSPP